MQVQHLKTGEDGAYSILVNMGMCDDLKDLIISSSEGEKFFSEIEAPRMSDYLPVEEDPDGRIFTVRLDKVCAEVSNLREEDGHYYMNLRPIGAVREVLLNFIKKEVAIMLKPRYAYRRTEGKVTQFKVVAFDVVGLM